MRASSSGGIGIAGLAALMCLLSALGPQTFAAEDVRYTRYNIHVQDKGHKGESVYEASYANWTDPGERHYVVPLNTAVRVEKGGARFWDKGFTFVVVEPDKLNPRIGKVYYEVNRDRVRMGYEEYATLITSPTPVGLDEFSAVDLEGIKAGKALQGMNKKGVMAALGYPSPHQTPSLEGAVYTYWKNRFGKLIVEFNAEGKVINIRR
jgi:hypothetical protein